MAVKDPREYMRDCLKKYESSKHMTDNELVAAVELLGSVEHVVCCMGERYRLFQYDISSKLNYFREYLQARGVDEKKQKKIWRAIQKRFKEAQHG